eukprot:m.160402 g.160402  ORF g.160402 m.160402 type:complete len:697 (+) comp15187_c0_seq5:289-2379(+)
MHLPKFSPKVERKAENVRFAVAAPSLVSDIYDRLLSAVEWKLLLYSEIPNLARERPTTLNLRERSKQHVDKYSHRHVSFQKNMLDFPSDSKHSAPSSQEGGHKAHHPSVSHRELFFDLIFVVVCIELGDFLAHDLLWQQLGYAFLLFTAFWLSWYHTNIILSSIRLSQPWRVVLFFVMLGALGLAANASNNSTLVKGPFTDHAVASAVFLLLPRLAFIIVYGNIFFLTSKYDENPKARRLRSGVFLFGFCLTSILCILIATLRSDAVTLALWVAILSLELLLYVIANLVVPPAQQWKVAPSYAIERNTVWIFLVLGESVISLGLNGTAEDYEYYLSLVLGFTMLYLVMRLFILSQPSRLDIFRHALHGHPLLAFVRNVFLFLMSFGILCLSVGLKFVMSHPGKAFRRAQSFLLVSGLATTFFFMHLRRFTNMFVIVESDAHIYNVEYNVSHGKRRRYFIWGLQCFLSLCFLLFGLVVGNGDTGVRPAHLLAMLIAWLVVMGTVDLCARPTANEKELMRRKACGIQFGDVLNLTNVVNDLERAVFRAPTIHATHLRPRPVRHKATALPADQKHNDENKRTLSDSTAHSRSQSPTPSSTASTLSSVSVPPPRSGRVLWAIVRHRFHVFQYTRRVARAMRGCTSAVLMRPGDDTLEVLEQNAPPALRMLVMRNGTPPPEEPLTLPRSALRTSLFHEEDV